MENVPVDLPIIHKQLKEALQYAKGATPATVSAPVPAAAAHPPMFSGFGQPTATANQGSMPAWQSPQMFGTGGGGAAGGFGGGFLGGSQPPSWAGMDMQQLMQNPQLMQQMMQDPMVQQMVHSIFLPSLSWLGIVLLFIIFFSFLVQAQRMSEDPQLLQQTMQMMQAAGINPLAGMPPGFGQTMGMGMGMGMGGMNPFGAGAMPRFGQPATPTTPGQQPPAPGQPQPLGAFGDNTEMDEDSLLQEAIRLSLMESNQNNNNNNNSGGNNNGPNNDQSKNLPQ
jgi:hypothetical protein